MTTVLGVIGVLVVLFVVAAVAVRDEALLADAPPDRADLDLPADGPIGAADLERVRFGMALRGYRMAQVDAVLDRLAGELLARDEQLAALSSELDRLRGRSGPVSPSAPQEESVPTCTSEVQDGAGPPVGGEAPQVAATPDEPPVEHVPDSGEGAQPLPDVEERPGAAPPAPVPFPEPVHADEPVQAPRAPDARAVRDGAGAPAHGGEGPYGEGAHAYSAGRPGSTREPS